jgi:hypothetical protein
MIKTLFAGLALVLAEEATRKSKSESRSRSRSRSDKKSSTPDFENGAPEVSEEDFIAGGGYFYDDDGNLMPTSRMSDGRYDHLGHIPDLSLPTDSYVWVQIPFWKVIESKVRTNPEDYKIIC